MTPCPRCRTAKHARLTPSGLNYCTRCGGLYDDEPGEGGDHSDRNPAVRLEREERRRARFGRRP